MSKHLSSLAWILGAVFIILAVYYWMTPAENLPAFFPGYAAGSTVVHIKHAIAVLLLGLACFAYAWFAGAKKAY